MIFSCKQYMRMLKIKLKLYCDVVWFDEIMCMFHEENARFIIF